MTLKRGRSSLASIQRPGQLTERKTVKWPINLAYESYVHALFIRLEQVITLNRKFNKRQQISINSIRTPET